MKSTMIRKVLALSFYSSLVLAIPQINNISSAVITTTNDTSTQEICNLAYESVFYNCTECLGDAGNVTVGNSEIKAVSDIVESNSRLQSFIGSSLLSYPSAVVLCEKACVADYETYLDAYPQCSE